MSDMNSDYHIPVLLDRSIDELVINPDGVYIDVTFGGGGHSKAILERITAKGRLFGFDQDRDAMRNKIDDPRFTFVHSNFEYLEHFMRYYGVGKVDGILADLGVSSHHFDVAERGFSYRFEADLDMRMNQEAQISAQDVLNKRNMAELQNILSSYGEVRNAKTLAESILVERQKRQISTKGDLDMILERCYRGDKNKYWAQVYQALRIEVNREFEVLKALLIQGRNLLAREGRFVVISYHSLEDRIVKQFFRDNNFSGKRLEDEYGRWMNDLKAIGGRPIEASDEELKKNRRAASAKMRVAVKIK